MLRLSAASSAGTEGTGAHVAVSRVGGEQDTSGACAAGLALAAGEQVHKARLASLPRLERHRPQGKLGGCVRRARPVVRPLVVADHDVGDGGRRPCAGRRTPLRSSLDVLDRFILLRAGHQQLHRGADDRTCLRRPRRHASQAKERVRGLVAAGYTHDQGLPALDRHALHEVRAARRVHLLGRRIFFQDPGKPARGPEAFHEHRAAGGGKPVVRAERGVSAAHGLQAEASVSLPASGCAGGSYMLPHPLINTPTLGTSHAAALPLHPCLPPEP